MAAAGHRNQRTNLPAGILVERSASAIIFSHTSNPRKAWDESPTSDFLYAIASAEAIPPQLTLTEADCRLNFASYRRPNIQNLPLYDPHTIVLDLDQLRFPLTIRNFQPGDRMRPFGLKGTQKIKQLFIDRKIPPPQRKCIPILTSGREVIWVAGLRRGAGAPLTEKTVHVLRIEMRALNRNVYP
jgi:tRNA(Ile)-lysidine synthase